MLHRQNGHLRINKPSLILSPKSTLRGIQQQCGEAIDPTPWIITHAAHLYGIQQALIGAHRYCVGLLFHHQKLVNVQLKVQRPNDKLKYQQLIHYQYIHHRHMIKTWLKALPPCGYDWGNVSLLFSSEQGGSEIRIAYRHLTLGLPPWPDEDTAKPTDNKQMKGISICRDYRLTAQ